MLTHIDMARAMFTGKPVFLFGHSMGGLLVVMAAQRRPNDFSGMALLAPLLGVSKHHAGWLTKTAVRLLGCLCPGLPVGSTPPYDLCCRDPAVVQRMANDPLQYRGSVYAGWGAAMMSALNTTLANTSAVQLPFFIQHGTDDKMCDLEYSKEFFKKAPSKDKSIKVYMGAYHSPLNEPEGVGEEVLKDLVAWFDARLPPSKSLILSPHDNDEGTDTTAKIFDSTV
ncbi:monoacylglycerol lipase-like [Haemaphysalis longicornis]